MSKEIGTSRVLSYEDLEVVRKIQGLTFGDTYKNVSQSTVKQFGNALLLLSHDSSRCGDYNIYSGDWDHHHHINLVSVDLSTGINLGHFPRNYTTEWPKDQSVQRLYEEQIHELYVEDGKLFVVIVQKWYGQREIKYGPENLDGRPKLTTWVATDEPVKTETKVLEFQIPAEFRS